MTGRMKDGQLLLDDKRSFEAKLAKLPDGPIVLRVEPGDETRTLVANRYYMGIVLKAIAEHTGSTTDELHKVYKDEFNGGKSTTVLSQQAFLDYVEMVRRHAAEFHGIAIPDAEQREAVRL